VRQIIGYGSGSLFNLRPNRNLSGTQQMGQTGNLANVPGETLTDALTAAYCEVAPKRLSEQLKTNDFE
jgi:hypothetical protein